jgi:hypothetical protein
LKRKGNRDGKVRCVDLYTSKIPSTNANQRQSPTRARLTTGREDHHRKRRSSLAKRRPRQRLLDTAASRPPSSTFTPSRRVHRRLGKAKRNNDRRTPHAARPGQHATGPKARPKLSGYQPHFSGQMDANERIIDRSGDLDLERGRLSRTSR